MWDKQENEGWSITPCQGLLPGGSCCLEEMREWSTEVHREKWDGGRSEVL